jgi:hypothetical protein
MDPIHEYGHALTRRHFFGQTSLGLGTAALASLLPQQSAFAATGIPEVPHFAPKAKRAIYLFMAGAPSEIDLLDYIPKLIELFEKDLRKMHDVQKGQRITTMTSVQASLPIAPSSF